VNHAPNNRQAPSWVLRGLERGFAIVATLAPSSARSAWGADARATFVETCRAAFTRGGWPSLVHAALAEWMDVFRAVLLVRIQARPVLHGAPPRVWGVRAWRDVRLATRSLRTAGTTTLTAVLTLTIGIGTSATVFSVLDSILWRQVPFRDAAAIVELANFNVAQKMTFSGFSRPLVLEWRRQADLFASVEAFERASFVFAGDRGTQMTPGAVVTPGLFDLLGVGAQMGRVFATPDGRGGTANAAIVSHAFWREQLRAAGDVIGQDIRLDGRRYRVAGVMPASFRFPSGLEQVWIPFDVAQPPADVAMLRQMTPIARLARGVTRQAAAEQVRSRGDAIAQTAIGRPGTTAVITESAADVDERSERSLRVLSGAVCFLFLIVCANVANLSLSRSAQRARDLATYAALGATPWDLARVAVIEQALLAALGVAGGAALAAGGVVAAVATLPASMTSETLNVIDLDGRALLFMMAGGAIAALSSGLAPALVATRTSIARVLGGSGRASSSVAAHRFRVSLAVVEVAVSVLLLVGSALMARSFLNRALEDPGFDVTNLVSLRVGFPERGYLDAKARDRAALDLAARLEALGGGARSTVGGMPSDTDLISFGQFEFDHRPGIQTEPLAVPIHEVPPGYFEAIGLTLRRGRAFRDEDAASPVVVNERFAQRFFAGVDPVGRGFRVGGGAWRTIVGVAADTTAATDDGTRRLETYYPIGTSSDAYRPSRHASVVVDFRTVLVRAPQGRAAVPQLTRAVHAFDPALVVWKAAMVEDVLAEAIARPRAILLLMTVFAGVGLVLSTAGLYAVLAHLVSQRRREFGVRLALGASAAQVRRSVLGRGLTIASIGVAIGLAAALSLVGTMRALLYDLSPMDPVSVGAATLLVGGTALFACWWPARNAGRVDPSELLRGE
jgi:predicted permease